MESYAAKYACQYGGRVFKPDERLDYNKEVVICPDCKGVKTEKVVCKLCKDSGRIDPPHHFKLIEGEEVHAKKEEKGKEVLEEADNQSINSPKAPSRHDPVTDETRTLRAEITRLGGSYSGRWGVERLQHELVVTQKKYGEKNAIEPKPESNA